MPADMTQSNAMEHLKLSFLIIKNRIKQACERHLQRLHTGLQVKKHTHKVSKKHLEYICMALMMLVILYILLEKRAPHSKKHEDEINVPSDIGDSLLSESSSRLLLYWNDRTIGTSKSGLEKYIEDTCGVEGIKFSKTLRDYNKSEVVLIDAYKLKSIYDLPKYKPADQSYVFYSLEAVDEYDTSLLSRIDNLFEITMTYRLDSDVFLASGLYYPRSVSNTTDIDVFSKKRLSTVWFASRCVTQSQRERYVKSLRKHTEVHTFGRCGDQKCKSDAKWECDRTLTKYKFSLAFETSLCKDYLTRKSFTALRKSTVPIVLGMANYSLYLPRDTYVNIFDYPNAQACAKRIDNIAGNSKAYNSFFDWRKDFRLLNALPKPDICYLAYYLLSKQKHERNSPYSLTKWWDKSAHCSQGKLDW